MASERVEGPTPNGGAYAIAEFLDEAGEPVDEAEAVRVELTEYDQEGIAILRTYASLVQREETEPA